MVSGRPFPALKACFPPRAVVVQSKQPVVFEVPKSIRVCFQKAALSIFVHATKQAAGGPFLVYLPHFHNHIDTRALRTRSSSYFRFQEFPITSLSAQQRRLASGCLDTLLEFAQPSKKIPPRSIPKGPLADVLARLSACGSMNGFSP